MKPLLVDKDSPSVGNVKPSQCQSKSLRVVTSACEVKKDHNDNIVIDNRYRLDSVSSSGQFDVVETSHLIALSVTKRIEGCQIPVHSKIQIYVNLGCF